MTVNARLEDCHSSKSRRKQNSVGRLAAEVRLPRGDAMIGQLRILGATRISGCGTRSLLWTYSTGRPSKGKRMQSSATRNTEDVSQLVNIR